MQTTATTEKESGTPVSVTGACRNQKNELTLRSIKPVVKGLLTFVPGLRSVLSPKGTGGTNSAAYCYGVWLKHLTLLWVNGVREIPTTLAELGPGESLGVGLAAMLCGTRNYYALDVIRHTDLRANLKILDELVALFKARAPRPTKGWPDYDPYLDRNLFPSQILTDRLLEISLAEERIASIRSALSCVDTAGADVTIQYMVPWTDPSVIKRDSVDLVLSHAVLQQIEDLEDTYRAMALWLKPNGIMSHQTGFGGLHLSKVWNGYRAFSELRWKAIMGRRPYLINREPYSTHVRHIQNSGCDLICSLQNHREDGITRAELSARWKDISDEDLNCSGAFIQARKRDEARRSSASQALCR